MRRGEGRSGVPALPAVSRGERVCGRGVGARYLFSGITSQPSLPKRDLCPVSLSSSAGEPPALQL